MLTLSIPFRIPVDSNENAYLVQDTTIFQFLSGFQRGTRAPLGGVRGKNFQFLSGFQIGVNDNTDRLFVNKIFQFLSGFQPSHAGLRPEFQRIVFQFLSGFQKCTPTVRMHSPLSRITFNSFPDSRYLIKAICIMCYNLTFNSFPDSRRSCR